MAAIPLTQGSIMEASEMLKMAETLCAFSKLDPKEQLFIITLMPYHDKVELCNAIKTLETKEKAQLN